MERPHPPRFPGGRPAASSKTSTFHLNRGKALQHESTSLGTDGNLHHLPPLSSLELEIMDLVWDLQECTSTDVITAYGKIRRLADTTIRTVLTNIRKKGYLELVPSLDRGHRFRPTLSRDKVARQTLDTLVQRLFKGRVREAITLLLADDLMTERDLEEIRRIVERRQTAVEKSA